LRVGRAEFDPARQSQAQRDIGRDMFGVGWLDDRLSARFALALNDQGSGRDDLKRAWTDAGLNPAGPLRRLAANVNDRAVRTEVRRQAKAEVLVAVRRIEAGVRGLDWLVEQLMPTVTVGASNGAVDRQDSREFLLELAASTRESPASVGSDGFTPSGRSDDGPRVNRSGIAAEGVPVGPPFVAISHDGPAAGRHGAGSGNRSLPESLDRLVVRVDFSRPLDPDALIFTSTEPPPTAPPVVPPVQTDQSAAADPGPWPDPSTTRPWIAPAG
jgi:hypothetical protein